MLVNSIRTVSNRVVISIDRRRQLPFGRDRGDALGSAVEFQNPNTLGEASCHCEDRLLAQSSTKRSPQ